MAPKTPSAFFWRALLSTRAAVRAPTRAAGRAAKACPVCARSNQPRPCPEGTFCRAQERARVCLHYFPPKQNTPARARRHPARVAATTKGRSTKEANRNHVCAHVRNPRPGVGGSGRARLGLAGFSWVWLGLAGFSWLGWFYLVAAFLAGLGCWLKVEVAARLGQTAIKHNATATRHVQGAGWSSEGSGIHFPRWLLT